MSLEKSETVLLKPPSVFLNRNFLLLFSGKIISQLLDQIYLFALSWFILDITKSSFQMAVFLVMNNLIYALITPLGGIIADRFNRKVILVWMDLLRGIIVLIAAFLLYQNQLHIWMVYISSILLASCGAIFAPAVSAIIPNIVEKDQLTKASSADQFIMSFSTMIGMLLSGVLYNLIGIFTIFLLNALSYFISGIMEACVDIPVIKQNVFNKSNSIYEEFKKTTTAFKDGYRYVKGNKLIYYLLLMNAMFNLIALPIVMVYTPYIFNVILKTTPFQLSLVQGAVWIGMIIGSLLVSLFLHRYQLKHAIFWGLLILSLCTFMMSLVLIPLIRSHVNNWEITIFLTITNIIAGIAVNFFTIPMYVIYQKYTSDEYRGRFWGLEGSIHTLAIAIGYFIAGILAQKVWMGFLFWSAVIGLLALNLWAINLKALKELSEDAS